MDTPITPTDMEALRAARALLENPGLAARMTNLIGSPIEKGLGMLPAGWNKKIGTITKAALVKAADVAISTLDEHPSRNSSTRWHKLIVATPGGVGGCVGLAGRAVVLPFSPKILMRCYVYIFPRGGDTTNSPPILL